MWDATCPDTLAPSHSSLANREAGAVAADAEHRKQQKYAHLDGSLFLSPLQWRRLVYSERRYRPFSGTSPDV